MSPTRVKTNQHKFRTVLDQILLKIWDQLKHEALPFNKGIYFIKHCVFIYSIYFQERSNLISIPETQGLLTLGKKTKNDLNFKENDLKLQNYLILKVQLETFMNYFKVKNLLNQKVSQIQEVSKFWHFANIYFRSRPLTFANGQMNMIKFFLRTHNSRKGGKQILAYIFSNICCCDLLKFRSCQDD